MKTDFYFHHENQALSPHPALPAPVAQSQFFTLCYIYHCTLFIEQKQQNKEKLHAAAETLPHHSMFKLGLKLTLHYKEIKFRYTLVGITSQKHSEASCPPNCQPRRQTHFTIVKCTHPWESRRDHKERPMCAGECILWQYLRLL